MLLMHSGAVLPVVKGISVMPKRVLSRIRPGTTYSSKQEQNQTALSSENSAISRLLKTDSFALKVVKDLMSGNHLGLGNISRLYPGDKKLD